VKSHQKITGSVFGSNCILVKEQLTEVIVFCRETTDVVGGTENRGNSADETFRSGTKNAPGARRSQQETGTKGGSVGEAEKEGKKVMLANQQGDPSEKSGKKALRGQVGTARKLTGESR